MWVELGTSLALDRALGIINTAGNSNEPKALALRGIVYSLQDAPKKAIEDFGQVKGGLRREAELYHKAKCLAKLKRFDEALQAANEGLDRHSASILLLQERAYGRS